ncbi:LysM-domain receptor kinase [Spatholobus suberectus]|nr:LysM-domain receptor kinase [Spatholobus suberectus]
MTRSNSKYKISYVVQPSDNILSIASMFGSKEQSIIDVNGDTLYDYDTIFIPMMRLSILSQLAKVSFMLAPVNEMMSGSERDRIRTI